MQKTNLDAGWMFSLDGSKEMPVNLPHDFSINRPRQPDSLMADRGGFFLGGNGVYKRILRLPPELEGGKVMLEVEGAYMNAEIFINGNLAAFHPYGYTSFHADLTPWVRFGGDNELEIRVGNNALPNSRWYSGSGLYRHVWMLTGRDSYIKPWGVYVTTPVAAPERSIIRMETDTEGGGVLRNTLLDAKGMAVCSAERRVSSGKSVMELPAADVQLWDVDSPYLYTLRTEMIENGRSIDKVDTKIGIRSILLDKEKGFLLNGKPLKLKGGCVHHDCGILGAASWDAAEDRKALAHQLAGFNAIRCAHNPPSPAFLDACDRYGIIVMDEAFDCWRVGKTPYDYHLYFETHWRDDIASMVLRDRNHPCIAFWSTGNEIPERFGRSGGYAIARELASAVRELDNTRFVTNALCGAWDQHVNDWAAECEEFVSALDVAGYNYQWKRYEEDLLRYPGRFIVGTESVAAEALPNWELVEKNPRILGDFVWTSLDYIGEAGIGHAFLPGEDIRTHGLAYPWHLANCGDLDICCRPRAQSFYRQILWGYRASPWIGVHRPNAAGSKPGFTFWGWGDVHHSWSWPGCEGFKVYIDVYSQCDEVELFLNGSSLGRKPAGKAASNVASFETCYRPGILKAVAYSGGLPAFEDTVTACGEPAAIQLDADREGIPAAWGGLAFVSAEIVDDNGNIVPYANHKLYFTVSGPGGILAVGNSDPKSEEPYVGNIRSAYNGMALAILNSNGIPGEIDLTVSADGLKTAQITLVAKE